jgi:hypothetical protein
MKDRAATRFVTDRHSQELWSLDANPLGRLICG